MVQLSSIAVMISVTSALAGSPACAFDAQHAMSDTRAESLVDAPRHGVWVYGVSAMLSTSTGADDLMAFARAFDINNVYLSVGNGLLANDKLPAFLDRLIGNGIRTDALMDCPIDPYNHAVCATSTRDNIEAVKAYNGAHPDNQDFKGVHLDIEPWVNTGEDTSWIEPLIALYEASGAQLSGTAVPLVADVSGPKMANLATPHQRQRMVDSLRRVVLMNYSSNAANVESWTTDFQSGVMFSDEHGIIVAVRAADFDPVLDELDSIEGTFTGTPGYRGWAVFQYATATCQTPAGC
jgi:hypothetical protein